MLMFLILSVLSAACSYYENRCQNGLCKHSHYWCNGIDDCGDMSDELGCGEYDNLIGTFVLVSFV